MRKFYSILQLSLALSVAGVFYCLYLVFLVVPNERVMGPVQRIFYFHVGSAIACYVSTGLLFIGALSYLATRERKYDALMQAAAEVGLLFCSIVMLTGMIWGQSAWNTPFRFEPRLVTFMILWMIYFSFNLLRAFGDPEKIAAHSAVLGIIGAIMVPVVWYSVKLLPQIAQLHPQVVENRGLRDPLFISAMFICMGVITLLQVTLVALRMRMIGIERRVKAL